MVLETPFVRSQIADHGLLYVVPAAGGAERQVSTVDTFSSAWSPDGMTILADGPHGAFTLVSAETSPDGSIHVPSSVGTIEQLFGARWSPDGDRIAFSMGLTGGSGTDIYTMRSDGTDLRRLTDDPGDEEFADWTQ